MGDLRHPVRILLALDKGAEERDLGGDLFEVEASHGKCLDPVEKLARRRLLPQAVHLAYPVELLDGLPHELVLDVGIVDLDDPLHHLLVGKFDVVEDAPSQEGVGQLLLGVARNDHDGTVLRPHLFVELVDMEGHLVELVQEVVGELYVRLVDLVDEEHHLLVGGKGLAELTELDVLPDVGDVPDP